jgi:hypothetical protein
MTTVNTVLFGPAEPAAVLNNTPGWRDALARLGHTMGALSAAGKATVERELSAALGRVLNLELGELIVAGLRRHPALVAAARATESNPTAAEIVQLAAHRVTMGHRPYVDVVVNGAKLATVHFDLDLTFDIDVLLATVQAARLTNIHSGRCTVTAALACEGHNLVSRQLQLDPALTVRLTEPIALLLEERRV